MNSYPIQVGLIGILVRTMDLDINRQATADLIRYSSSGYRNADRICGFDLADAEDRSNPEDFLPMVQQAREEGLGITIRSGVPVSINSDDPNLFGIDLVHEYEVCAEVLKRHFASKD